MRGWEIAGLEVQRAMRLGPRVGDRVLGLVGIRAGLLALALIAAFAVADARAAVLPVPRVKAETEELKSGTIVVRSLLVQRIHGRLRVACNRCHRLVGPIRTSRPSRTSKRFTGVNWILPGGRAIRVTVVRRGRIGRYLLLTAKRQNGRMGLGYKESGCLNQDRDRILCPRGTPLPPPQIVQSTPVTTPPPSPPPSLPGSPTQPPPPPAPPAATTSDAKPCEPPVSRSWSSEPVQRCPLVGPLPPNNWVPVYARPVARATGAPNPATAGWLHSTVDQYFVCQREFASAEYYHPQGYRNRWWAYTLSDDGGWGWTPQVFFQGGNDDEPDNGLVLCGSNHT